MTPDEIQKFLQKGLELYLPGFSAFVRFHREIYSRIESCFSRNLPALCSAADLDRKDKDIKNTLSPKRSGS